MYEKGIDGYLQSRRFLFMGLQNKMCVQLWVSMQINDRNV